LPNPKGLKTQIMPDGNRDAGMLRELMS
jgi:hypothetical protein